MFIFEECCILCLVRVLRLRGEGGHCTDTRGHHGRLRNVTKQVPGLGKLYQDRGAGVNISLNVQNIF